MIPSFKLGEAQGSIVDINEQLSVENSPLDNSRISTTWIQYIVKFILSQVISDSKTNEVCITGTLIEKNKNKNE